MDFNNIQPLPVVCRQSSIKCAVACERCWFYKHRMRARLRGVEYKEAATLGKIYHRLQQYGPGKESETKKWVAQQQRKLMDRVQRGEDLDGNMTRLANQLTTLYNKAEVMAHVFWERFPQPEHFKVIGTEIKHSMKYNGLIIEGTIDKLILHTKDKPEPSVWIRDHKNTGRPLAVIFGGLPWSIQARIYRLLAEDYHANHVINPYQIRGFILDGIITPGIKLCKTDEKNAKDWNCSVEDAYLRRVKEWYRDYEIKADLGGKKNTKAIDSRGILYTEPEIPPELERILAWMQELHSRPLHPEYFHRDVTRMACFQYEKQCIYHDLCETDPTQWDSLFETKYQIKPVEDNENEEEDSEDNSM